MPFRSRLLTIPSDAAPDAPDAPPSPARRRWLRRGLTTGVLAAGLGAAAWYGHDVEADDLVVERSSVRVAGWPAGYGPVRLGLLSDFHVHDAPSLARTRRAVRMLLAERPDAVLLGGDYITWDIDLQGPAAVRRIGPSPWIPRVARALAPLAAAPLGAYAVLGNHDYWSASAPEIVAALTDAGCRVLRNESAPLPGSGHHVWIVGVDDVITSHADSYAALTGVPPPACKLLLVHEPDFADEAGWFFALQLSGHSHAGQVRVFGRPLYCPPLGQRYPQGLEQSPSHPVYTTRGVGMVAPEIRIDCPPEVTVLTVGG